MPPKEDSNKNEQTLPGFDARETKMLAAAYLATTGIDKVRAIKVTRGSDTSRVTFKSM